jgi:hypothetical protein
MKYFAIIDGKQCGPFELEQLPEAGIRPDTYIWCQKMDDWMKAEDVAEVCRFYRRRIADGGSNEQIETVEPEVVSNGNETNTNDDLPWRFKRIIEKSGEIPEPLPDTTNYDEPPRTMLVEAIIATILCCPITGIVAIYCAIQVSRFWKSGAKEEAHEASRKAKMWTGISFFMGFLLYAFLSKLLGIF